jgi:hypothetical protein
VRTVIRLLASMVGAALLLSGCSSEEGLRAQTLLQQAQVEQAALSSSTFEGGMSFTYEGKNVSMQFRGATSGKDEWFSLRANGLPGGGDISMQMIVRGGRAWTNFGGRWQSSQAPATGSSGTMSAAAFQELARYVKDVRVTEHQVVAGKLVTTIAGDIDTQGMVEGLAKLGPFASAEGLDLSKLGVDFGDIHALMTIDERTRLLTGALVTFAIDASGESLTFDLRYRLTSFNEPVKLPAPGG